MSLLLSLDGADAHAVKLPVGFNVTSSDAGTKFALTVFPAGNRRCTRPQRATTRQCRLHPGSPGRRGFEHDFSFATPQLMPLGTRATYQTKPDTRCFCGDKLRTNEWSKNPITPGHEQVRIQGQIDNFNPSQYCPMAGVERLVSQATLDYVQSQ